MAHTASQFRDLAQVAADKGMKALYNEQMYTPSETPWTIAQGYRFIEQGVPTGKVNFIAEKRSKL